MELTENPIRVALVDNASASTVSAYLPSNYSAVAQDSRIVRITGRDRAGWTLDGYVIPRLASGLIFAREVTPNN